MKNLLLTGFLLAIISISARAGDTINVVRFCFHEYTIPGTCTIQSPTEIRSASGNLSWVYVERDNLLFSWNALVNKLQTYTGFTKERIRCFIAGKEVNGYRISYLREGKTAYQLVAYGIINSQAVLVQLGLKKNPISNSALPDFAKGFIRLAQADH